MEQSKTVVITSANCVTAGLLIPKLKAAGYYTVGLIRKQQQIETDKVIIDWMNSDEAKRALEDADYIVHLSGEINSKEEAIYIQSNLTTTQIVAAAARKGKAKRVIFLSYPGADVKQKNLYLKYKGEAEKLLTNAGKEAVIFRCPVIIDSPEKPSRIDTLFKPKNGKGVPVIGTGKQPMHPVYRGDVVNIILAALARGKAGIYDLSGHEGMTTDEFIQLVNQNPKVRIDHTPAWLSKILARFIKGLSPTFVDILLNHTDSVYDADTYGEFGTTPVSIVGLWSKQSMI